MSTQDFDTRNRGTSNADDAHMGEHDLPAEDAAVAAADTTTLSGGRPVVSDPPGTGIAGGR
ncbi:hypothetical protein ACU686_25460 [Yinghuangia aomiensis]